MKSGKIYLFPSFLAPTLHTNVLPQRNIELIREIRWFVVEELRTARRFLKACDRSIDIDILHFDVLNEHTPAEAVDAMLAPALEGHDMGIISEAGCPAVADPGADLVAVAQRKGVEVVPLVGPSSILLSLMASGFNGQSFTFLGYLPIDNARRAAVFRQMEHDMAHLHRTQIFIETPYRNNKLVDELCRFFSGSTLLCVAANLTGENEFIKTQQLSAWKHAEYDFAKRPAIFLLYR